MNSIWKIRWILMTGFALGWMPGQATAQMMMEMASPAISIELLRSQALELEKKGNWEAALQAYFQLSQLDKSNVELHDKMNLALRHVLQGRRHRDRSFQEKVMSLTAVQAGSLYEEVLDKLQSLYVDRNKSQLSKLFRSGLDELEHALQDRLFRETYLKDVSSNKVEEFVRRIKEAWLDRDLKSIKEVRLSAATIARVAHQQLGLSPNAVILEFLCGACNSLDEYTAYLSPADLVDDGDPTEATVIDAAILKEGVGYLRISSFRDSTPDEFDATLNAFKAHMEGMNLKSIIIDLRGNLGGDFQAAVRIAERFVNQGVIASTIGQVIEANKIFTPTPGAPLLPFGLVVLVDGQTASAAEVLAYALRDHQRAKIIGTPTFGKGSIQKVVYFKTAQETDEQGKPKNRTGAIRITLARIFSPNGQAISGGVTPHIIATERDQQMATALQEAGQFSTLMRP